MAKGKWEYLIHDGTLATRQGLSTEQAALELVKRLNDQLNELGEQGWQYLSHELVPVTVRLGMPGREQTEMRSLYLFARPAE